MPKMASGNSQQVTIVPARSRSFPLLMHNHPSGDPSPSKADIAITQEVVAAASALGIAVHDHLIIGRNGQKSFKTMGLL